MWALFIHSVWICLHSFPCFLIPVSSTREQAERTGGFMRTRWIQRQIYPYCYKNKFWGERHLFHLDDELDQEASDRRAIDHDDDTSRMHHHLSEQCECEWGSLVWPIREYEERRDEGVILKSNVYEMSTTISKRLTSWKIDWPAIFFDTPKCIFDWCTSSLLREHGWFSAKPASSTPQRIDACCWVVPTRLQVINAPRPTPVLYEQPAIARVRTMI